MDEVYLSNKRGHVNLAMDEIKEEQNDVNAKADSCQSGQSSDEPFIWDVFRKDKYDHNEPLCQNPSKIVLKIVKVLTYIFLLLAVFGGVILVKATLQILVTHYQISEKYQISVIKDGVSYYLIFIISIPDALKFIQSSYQFIFGKREAPAFPFFLLVIVREGVHLVSLYGLVFKVMPLMNTLQICAVTTGIPLVPSVIHTLIKCACNTECKRRVSSILNVVALAVFLVVLVVVPVLTLDRIPDDKKTEFLIWMSLSYVFIPLRWIETYADKSKRFRKMSTGYKGRVTMMLLSSTLRLALACLLIPLYFCQNISEPLEVFNRLGNYNGSIQTIMVAQNCTEANLQNSSSAICTTIDPASMNTTTIDTTHWREITTISFFIHFFVAILCYHCSVVACKLRMQRLGFAIPLSLATPAYVLTVLITDLVGVDWIKSSLTIGQPIEFADQVPITIFFFIAWLSQLWISKHVWGSAMEQRLSSVERLFVLPHYCSPIIDLSILHSRRRKSKEKYEESKSKPPVSKIYVCATMWHENRQEMKQILTSLFRLDMDQAVRYIGKEEIKEFSGSNEDIDYYEFEVHILFDDAMTTTEDNKRVPNEFVQQFEEVINEAGRSLFKIDPQLEEPERIITPYGGRLVYTLPGSNKVYVHLKDKDKIRHKKRWSQIMYLYYLIGYKLMEENKNSFPSDFMDDIETKTSVFRNMPEEVVSKAENTFLLALDGDVDFEPDALRLLVDRMKKNPNVAATCGRIKPGGSGPVVWYQRFEYAIGHWLQKSAEHKFGCVLCSPGCFSLFRAKSLMDDNVMRTYAILPTEPRHYLQYDQGEDRWLCTLLLQQGYRVEYCAAAEAITFAPEEFKEFFNQRRRWLPSTMANIYDLLQSYERTSRINPNISYLYIFYQTLLFVSSVLGPSTVLLAMESALASVLAIPGWASILLTYLPTFLFILICLKFKTNTQLNFAMVLSVVYALLMMAVVVGTFVNIAVEGWFTPSAIFLYVLVAVFLLAGLFHPHEFGDLLWGILYFICIPAGYLFLIIYAVCNMNNVSWGTRETQKPMLEQPGQIKPKQKKPEEELGHAAYEFTDKVIKEMKEANSKKQSCRNSFFSIFRWINNLILLKSLESINSLYEKVTIEDESTEQSFKASFRKSFINPNRNKKIKSSQVDSSSWAKHENTKSKSLKKPETQFWNNLISNYLKPLDANKTKEREMADQLKEFRNKMAFAFFFLNGLWLVIMTAMNEVRRTLSITIPQIYGPPVIIEPLGLIFLVVFALLLLMQLIGMIWHRYGTFLHVIAATELRRRTSDYSETINKIRELVKPVPEDYDENDDEAIYTNYNGGMEDIYEINEVKHAFTRKQTIKAGGVSVRKTVRKVKSADIKQRKRPLDLRKTFRNHMRETRETES